MSLKFDISTQTGLLKNYLERRKLDLALCREALEARESAVLEQVGHRLRGNCETFGFPELMSVGEELERCGRARNFDDAARALARLQEWLFSREAA